MNDSSPQASKLRRAHPLAALLIARLAPSARVLDFGTGSGRNADAMEAAGFAVDRVADAQSAAFHAEPQTYDGAIGTHAFLHGTPATIAQLLEHVAEALKPDAPLYATFGSKRDVRYGAGTPVAPDAFAPESGDEAGVPHAYFDKETLREMLVQRFFIESLEERNVEGIAGRWAHAQPLSGSVHWFARARRR